MSMNYYGTTPDLHLYDIERIEVLNGPQGTTFGASAMSGALRFITNKPDATAFSAGVDLDGGKIDGGTHNGTAEGFVNLPIVDGWTALRVSAFSDYHGGFINNQLTTRTWVNGSVSDNSAWAGKNYNVEKVTGGRIALGQKISDGWKATLTYSYQRQLTHGAWDADPTIGGALDYQGNLVDGPARPLPPNTVVRFGPEFKRYFAKTADFHLDGDVGIGDLVYASTYWAQDDRWVNEYSEYMQYLNQYANPPDAYFNASTQQAFTCLTDPVNGSGFSGCKPPIQYYDYDLHIYRWSNELRLQSKEGGRFHWLAGVYWEKTKDFTANIYHMPGLQTAGQAWQATTAYYYNQGALPPTPDDWYSYESPLRLSANDRVRQRRFRHHAQAAHRARHGALPLQLLDLDLRRILVRAADAEHLRRVVEQVGWQGRHQLQADEQRAPVRQLGAGVPGRRGQRRACRAAAPRTACRRSTRPTR